MRILIVHNSYQHAGGEDAVLAAEMELLAQKGHAVDFFCVSNDSIRGVREKVRAALGVVYSGRSRDLLLERIRSFRPDVVHVHNFFPQLTPSVYDACSEAGVAVVQTLHNYRAICPGALLLRGGRTCEICLSGSPYHAVRHRCYRGSRLGSLAVAAMVDYHRRGGTWREKVQRFIALTDFAKEKFVAAGFPGEKIAVKPNFSVSPAQLEASSGRAGALFVGRLSEEKGVNTLLRAWEKVAAPLTVIGDGPLAGVVAERRGKGIDWDGRKSNLEVSRAMREAAFLVMPSECSETFGMVIIEAFAHRLPVVASRLGSMAELVEEGVTGLLFQPGDAEDLAQKARWAAQHPEEMRRMGLEAEKRYLSRYTPERNYTLLLNVYRDAIAARGVTA